MVEGEVEGKGENKGKDKAYPSQAPTWRSSPAATICNRGCNQM